MDTHLQFVSPETSYPPNNREKRPLLASSPGRSDGGARKGRGACNYVSSGIWIPPPIPLWLPVDWAVRFPPISAKRKQALAQTKFEKQVPRVMTSLLSAPPISISHRLFRCRYPNSRDVVASSPSFSRPAARAPQRSPSQASSMLFSFIKIKKKWGQST